LDTEYDIIEAQSIYIDGGNSYITTEDAEYFAINSASGRFQGATHIKIIYDNEGTKAFNPEKKKFVRQVLILKSV
jgi:outer membrane protein assembly factor BamB